MSRWRLVAVLLCLMAASRTTLAQGTGNATIVGVARDASGGVLPGVTVEASSPSLSEGVRSVVTDEKGEFRILELRPGTYSVSFSLPGFSTLKREGIQLSPSFTATLNAELKVGELNETVTVSGDAPLIDTQTLTQQKTIRKEILDAVPTAKSMLGIAALMPSVVQPPNAQDVGGSKGERSVRLSVHGGKTTDARLLQDGMRYNALTPGIGPPLVNSNLEGTGRGYYVNPLASQEIVIDIGTMGSAQYEYGGAQVNTIQKDGGNTFSGSAFLGWTGHQLQADNLTDELRSKGLASVNSVRNVYDFNLALGGPIIRERLWFLGAGRRWGTQTAAANLYGDANIASRVPGAPASAWRYSPDFSTPIRPLERDKAIGVRFTGQATSKDRLTFSYDWQKNFQDQLTGQLETGTIKNEANAGYCQQQDLTQATWTRPSSSRFLFDAGVTVSRFDFGNFGRDLTLSDFIQCGAGLPDNVSIQDTALGYTYNGTGNRTLSLSHQTNGRFNVTYLPGDHQIKAGVFWMYGLGGGHRTYSERTPAQVGGVPVSYLFNNGTPIQLTQYASPVLTIDQLNPDLGLYIQDQWRLKRVTVSAGLRYDWVRESVPAISVGAGPLVPARSFPALENVPNWRDLNPRFGVVWDPFGDSRTAVKAGINRYVMSNTTGIANVFDPANASVNNASRAWTDLNANFVPDCDLTNKGANGECGVLLNQNFGNFVATTVPDPEWITGWKKRPYNWQMSLAADRELWSGVQVSGGYYRTWYGNFFVVDNLAVTPADYSPYCVTAPSDPRLPASVSGSEICGLFDLNPNKVGQANNVVTAASNYGKQTEVYNGVDASLNARLPHNVNIGGGWNIGNALQTGTTAGGISSASTNNCYVVDSPQQLFRCKVDVPYQNRFKMNATYLLPWYGIQVAGVFQSNPGPNYNATATFTTAQVQQSLGRPLSGGVRTVSVNLVEPFSQFGPRINQFDVRASKITSFGTRKLQANVDLYNVLNKSSVVNFNSTYGSTWLQPTQILDGRLVKFSLQVDF